MGEKSDRLARAANKALLYKLNNVKNPAVHQEFMQAMYEFANSDEMEEHDYSQPMGQYKNWLKGLSEIPMAALHQHLKLCKEVLCEIETEYKQNGLSDNYFQLQDYLFVIMPNFLNLCEQYGFEFTKLPYPENDKRIFKGLGIEFDDDPTEYTVRWMVRTKSMLRNAEKALDADDILAQKIYFTDFCNMPLFAPYES